VIETFSWGYWGWGGSTRELVKAFDAAEKLRGFAPPVFVDVRVRRTVRAVGFCGDAFEKRLGSERYRWMDGLGNQGVADRSRDMYLRDATKVRDLLDLVVDAHARQRHVIFFCACRDPRRDGTRTCHRDLVGELLVKEARRRRVALAVVEWPGSSPLHLVAVFPPEAARASLGDAQGVRVPRGMSPAVAVSIPWGSYALVEGRDGAVPLIVGPAVHAHGRWALRVPWTVPEPPWTEIRVRKAIMSLRRGWGHEPRYSLRPTRENDTAWKDLVVGGVPQAPKSRSTANGPIKTPAELRKRIEQLSARSPLTDRFAASWRRVARGGQREQERPWYENQREHWLGWLADYRGPGAYGRKNAKRSAQFVYDHVVNPQMLVYLAEAVGLDRKTVETAMSAALAARDSTMAAMSGAFRRVIPWEMVEAELGARV
jgi:hypothetical protein